MTGTMQAVVKTAAAAGSIAMQTLPIPQPGPREILVRVKAAAVCGTDVHIRRWNPWAQARMNPPVVIGHEFSGEVVETGSEVRTVRVGDRVSAESHIPCNTCPICHEGNRHVCPNTRCIGVHQDGCFAQYIVIPEEIAFVYNDSSLPWEQLALMEPLGVAVHGITDVPLAAKTVAIIGAGPLGQMFVYNDSSLPWEQLALMEPLGVAVHGITDVPLAAKTVAIIGAGPLGQMGILTARLTGAARVIVLEPDRKRAALAEKLGADHVIDPLSEDPVAAVKALTGGFGPHVAVDFSGSQAGLAAAMQYLRPEGQLTCVALPDQPVSVSISDFGYRGCSIRGIAGRRMYENWEEIRGLLDRGLDLSPIVTHRLPLQEFAQGLDLTEQGACGKCILLP